MNHALLLTDVVDSTKLSEQLGDAAAAALWARHDRLARDLLAARARLEHAEGHREVARQTLGETEALARQAGAGPEDDLGQALAKARAVVEAP